ncbi:hypothetical protein SmJEL517_g00599 [Synchytrium microbalum]|uniref:CN hydrolase domain-containing protein n=1 Tax=Synchytrium microbalum TaxID=1806994 RepID=A0A507CHQ0_9FUNG|nr:uncharacterized protein SmJEL517_g00599 [Synchytrium microbalum]TPX37636.1 hypothetical protein SmJEL517_g00599 [Synchytrium microbalum]
MKMLASVGQFCASAAVESNLASCVDIIRQSAARGASMVFLPEASDFIAENKDQALSLTESLDIGKFVAGLKDAAKTSNVWISAGVHETSPFKDRLYNTHIVINAEGLIASVYRKIHLFDVDIKDGPKLMESAGTVPGPTIVSPVETPIGKVGLMVCFDLRFPELSWLLRRRGADILTYPSAFTVPTGLAHWEPLIRARAIETQCYVIASALTGKHNPKRESYGHAIIVDPWGQVIAHCSNTAAPTFAIGEIDLKYLNKIRMEMPVLNQRRDDLYQLAEVNGSGGPTDTSSSNGNVKKRAKVNEDSDVPQVI